MSSCFDETVILELHTGLCDDIDTCDDIPHEDSATRDAVEDKLLATLLIDQALERLPSLFRALVELLYAYRVPPGYAGLWPPTTQDIGRYLGERFYARRPVPPRTVLRWHQAVLAHWHSTHVAKDITQAFATTSLLVPRTRMLARAA